MEEVANISDYFADKVQSASYAKEAKQGKKDYYHTINIVCLTSFMMIMPFIQQKFNVTVLPLALCLLICSATVSYTHLVSSTVKIPVLL